MVIKQPQFTRVEEPTLLCNQLGSDSRWHSTGSYMGGTIVVLAK
jgi:hypothetical protein